MTLQNVLEAQIDAAIKGLVHARARITLEAKESEAVREVLQQLETVSFHLQDIQYNWLSLNQLQRNDAGLPAAGITH
ncbi:MAG: hypothetical protein KGZ83_20850 [Sulfuricella sp.]|nr:hypothetical protein [Sulfuricella sp.]